MHSSDFGATSFNPGYGHSRFAPLIAVDGAKIPTLYAAGTFQSASFEYVFHDIDPAAPFKTIPLSSLNKLTYSVLRLTRDTHLARLFEIDLNRMGATRSQVIDTPPSTYGDTVQWCRAVHDSSEELDGMIWTSRKCDPDSAIILFGDRLNENELEMVSSDVVMNSPILLEQLRASGAMAGIVLTV